MNPIKLVTLTTAKTANLAGTGGGTGERIGVEDIALACSGLDRKSFLACRLAWAGDCSVHSELRIFLHGVVDSLAELDNWKRRDYEAEERMVDLAMFELAHPGRVKSNAERAKAIDKNESTYSRIWAHRYEPLYSALTAWTDRAYDHIKRKQQEGEQC